MTQRSDLVRVTATLLGRCSPPAPRTGISERSSRARSKGWATLRTSLLRLRAIASAATNARIGAEIAAGNVGGHPTFSASMKEQQRQQLVQNQADLAANIDTTPALALTLPGTTGSPDALASIKATGSAVTASMAATFSTLKTSIDQDYTATFETATQKIQANLAQLESQLDQYALIDVSRAQDVAKLKVEAEATAQAQIIQLQDDASKAALDKAEQESGQLFDALLSGSSKKISTQFQKVFEQIATAPIKKLFEVSMAAALKPLDDSLANAVKPYVTSISNWILGKKNPPNPFDLNNPNNPYATGTGALASIWAASSGQNGNVVNSGADPNNPLILNALGRVLGIPNLKRPGGGVPGGTAPVFQISDATMYVQTLSITASTVNLTTGATVPQSPVSSTLDGASNPRDWFSGADSYSSMNLMPSLASLGSGLNSLSSLAPALMSLPSLVPSLASGIQARFNWQSDKPEVGVDVRHVQSRRDRHSRRIWREPSSELDERGRRRIDDLRGVTPRRCRRRNHGRHWRRRTRFDHRQNHRDGFEFYRPRRNAPRCWYWCARWRGHWHIWP